MSPKAPQRRLNKEFYKYLVPKNEMLKNNTIHIANVANYRFKFHWIFVLDISANIKLIMYI